MTQALNPKKMRYKAEAKISIYHLEDPKTEERNIRELARLIIDDIPLEQLKKVFHYDRLDPESPEGFGKLSFEERIKLASSRRSLITMKFDT